MRKRRPRVRRGRRPVRVLATGFGPFPGTPVNVSALLMRELAAASPRPMADGVLLKTAVIPTAWRQAGRVVHSAARAFRADLIVHFGVSRDAPAFTLERLAHNRCAGLADCYGDTPARSTVAAGPSALPTRLDASVIRRALNRAGFALDISDDAGAYLCNFVYYRSLKAGLASNTPRGAERRSARSPRDAANAVFIHIPKTGEARGSGGTVRARGDLIRGVRALIPAAALAVAAGRRRPVARERLARR